MTTGQTPPKSGRRLSKRNRNAIKALYQTRSKMITVNLGKKLQSAKLGNEDNACAHFTRLMDLQEQLTSMGKILDDDEFVSILLGSLPPSYSPTIGGINAAADSTGNAINPTKLFDSSQTSMTAARFTRTKMAQTRPFPRQLKSNATSITLNATTATRWGTTSLIAVMNSMYSHQGRSQD